MAAAEASTIIRGIFKETVYKTLAEALTAAAADGAGKCWAILPAGDCLQAVHEALKEGSGRLGIVITADAAPASQIEVLRALEYTGVFVAATDFSCPKSCAKVLKEARSYEDGPAFVMLAAPAVIANDKAWTSFTFDPRREAAGAQAFIAESGDNVRKEIQAFLDRDNLLTLIAKKALPAVASSGEEDGDLAAGVGDAGKTITILYSSDTGHSQECAKAVARQCRNGGFPSSCVRCVTMDSFDVGALASESLVVFCVATAGKGEFAGNGRGFWENINARAAELKGTLGGMKYCIFGLGDSHYWGKGTEDSKVNFAKPARDLDAVFEEIGAPRLLPMAFGDDQDVDQYHTGFGEFKSQLYSRLGVDKVAAGGGEGDDAPVKSDEMIKVETKQLRGSLKESLDDVTTGEIPFQDTKLIKSHGSYQQDDRDLRDERQKLGIENAFSFMIRVRMPGGFCTSEQWSAMDDICEKYANGTLKITTRQTWQVHGVLKRDVKATMRAMNRACMDTLAACGDVCRNVMATSDPSCCSQALMDEILAYTYAIHDHCLPRSGAYHEIFLMHGEEMAEKTQVLGTTPVEEEPLYGLTYLPRKYKVALAIPPSNDVDVFAHCCGFIAIITDGVLQGFNVTVGGGLGFTHNNGKTHPRLADVIGFCKPKDAKYVCECIMTVSRDFGDRTGRKHARVKYTVEDYGKAWYLEQVNDRLGFDLEPARPYKFTRRGDFYDWTKTEDGLWHCGCHIPIGRVRGQTRVGLRKIAETLRGTGGLIRMTCNQQVVVGQVPANMKEVVQQLLDQYQVMHKPAETVSGLRRNMIACVAMPTCPLAFAEAERYLPTLVGRLEVVTEKCGLLDRDITIRMTGCPNSCGRPSMAEIGFIGKAPGTYNMYMGGDFVGERLNTLYAESVTEDQIIAILTPIFGKYAKERNKGEVFGDFCVRMKYVKPMLNGRTWWSLPQV